jgi:hypothetical protein
MNGCILKWYIVRGVSPDTPIFTLNVIESSGPWSTATRHGTNRNSSCHVAPGGSRGGPGESAEQR